MPIFIPIIAGTVIRYVVGGVVVYVVGKKVVAEVDESAGESIEEIEAQITEAGGNILEGAKEELGDLSLDFIRGIIPAIIEGAQAGYSAIVEGFRGKEPQTIAALTIAVLVAVAFFTLLHEVKTGPGGAGEYGAGNRP